MEKQGVNSSGSNLNIRVAARGIIERQENFFQYFQETEFFEPKLDRYAPPEYPKPKGAEDIIEALLNQNLVLIGASPEIDKPALCRHFAWRLRVMLSTSLAEVNGGNSPAVQEWGLGTCSPDLAMILRQTEKKTIFILPQFKPHDAGYNLKELAEAAKHHGHYVIASTDASPQTWRIDADDPLRKDLTPETIYEPGALAEIFLQRLNDARRELKGISDQEPFGLDRPLGGHSTPRELSQRLKTPENISMFIRLLRAEGERVTADTIEWMIESVQNDESTLELWFRSLQMRDQMLALGLSLFEQLFDDQFFVAFEHLVENKWHRRDESLRAVDYCDLEELQNFFNLVHAGSQIQDESYVINIQGRLPNQRQKLFRVAWNSHRRQILAALPVMVQLARASVRGGGVKEELYGSNERRDQLRRAVSDAISDIGLISTQLVEESLLNLAADRDWAVQAVAARAVARWREYKGDGKNDLMIQTLRKWEKDTRSLSLVRSFIEGSESEKKVDPINYIRATVALAVGYAAYYDPPNELSNELYAILKELADDSNRFVRDRFCRFTLPVVVRLHWWQLRHLLWEKILQPDLIDRIAWSLAEARRVNPSGVEWLLNKWAEINEQNKPSQIRSTELSDYEKRLAAIVLTYGWTKYDNKKKMENDFESLENILRKEESPLVRRAVALSMSRQIERDFENAAPKLQQLMKHIAAQDRRDIVVTLQDIYFDQRSKLNGGDETVEIGSRYYDTWTDGRRKMTVIEREMIKWIKNPDYPSAQRIAVHSSVLFAKSFDQEEKKQIARLLEGKRHAVVKKETIEFKEAAQISVKPKEYKLGFYTNVALRFASRHRSENMRLVLKGLFPEVMNQRSSNRSAMEFVMERWRNPSDHKLSEIARALDQAIWIYDKKGIILLFSFIGAAVLLMILYFVIAVT
ncbi:MAG: hypothetical protein J2P21_24435 [Chloracidobacterium sp.]|nr:hypothetical protein [Chloracidobacterium sp.]